MSHLASKNTTNDIFEISKLLSFILDQKDTYTADHSKVVRTVSVYLGKKLGFSRDMLVNLNVGGYMHDIGKIIIPDDVLFKPGKLTDSEFDIVKNHTTFGSEFIEKFSVLNRYKNLVLHHHEHYDGNGYPCQIEKNKISVETRLISVADVYHALYSKRCYKPAFSKQEIIDEFKKCRGKQFDPYLTDELLSAIYSGEISELLNNNLILENFEHDLQWQLKDVDLSGESHETSLMEMLDVLTTALDIMNPMYADHCSNVKKFASEILSKMDLDEQDKSYILIAASLHDIGRMGQRPGLENAEAYDLRHAEIGADMLSNIESLSPILDIIRYHSEPYNGAGKLYEKTGKQIPLGSRIIIVADYLDSFTKRPDAILGRPLNKKEAVEKIQRLSGKLFDPDLVSLLSECDQIIKD